MLHPNDPFWDQVFTERGDLTVVATGGPGVDLVGADGVASSFTIVRELTGDLPAEVTLVGGGVTSYMDVVADAAMEGAPHPLRRTDRDAWISEPVTVAAGYDGDTLRSYTGLLREFGFDEVEQALDLKVIENSDSMRGPVSVQLQGTRVTKKTGRRKRFPINLTALHVAALHASGIRVTPPPPAGTVFSAPLVGAALADVGWLTPTNASTGVSPGIGEGFLRQGKFGPMPGPAGQGSSWQILGCGDRRPAGSGALAKARVEFWYNRTASTGGAHSPVYLQTVRPAGSLDLSHAFLTFSNSTVSASVTTNGATTAGPSRALVMGWNHVELLWTLEGNLELRVNGSSASAPVPPVALARETNVLATLGAIQQLSMWVGGPRDAFPPNNYAPTFAPEADLDVSRLTLESMPVVDARPAWDLVKELAAAELGMVGFSEEGRYYFKNRDKLNASTPVVATWGVDLVDNLAGSATSDSVRSRVTASVPRPLLWDEDGPSGDGEAPAYMHPEAVFLPTGDSTIVLAGSLPMLPPWLEVPILTDYADVMVNRSGMVLCHDEAGAIRYTGSSVTAILRRTGSSSVWELDVHNGSGSPLWVAWPAAWSSPTLEEPRFSKGAGDGALWVYAATPQRGDEVQTSVIDKMNPDVPPKWQDRTYDIPQSDWCQDVEAVEWLAGRMLVELARPRAEIGDVTVPADLRVQIGDRVRLTDWRGRLPDVIARITRSEVTISRDVENGMIGRYSLRSQAPTLHDVNARWMFIELEDVGAYWAGQTLGDVSDEPA